MQKLYSINTIQQAYSIVDGICCNKCFYRLFTFVLVFLLRFLISRIQIRFKTFVKENQFCVCWLLVGFKTKSIGFYSLVHHRIQSKNRVPYGKHFLIKNYGHLWLVILLLFLFSVCCFFSSFRSLLVAGVYTVIFCFVCTLYFMGLIYNIMFVLANFIFPSVFFLHFFSSIGCSIDTWDTQKKTFESFSLSSKRKCSKIKQKVLEFNFFFLSLSSWQLQFAFLAQLSDRATV